jgi:hypothetical protein
MQEDQVIIVHLRRPRSKSEKPDEMRSDPFWELGSFGITTCHRKNLMHPDNAEKLNGARFAFAQGGRQGTRLVYLTPPVMIRKHRECIEALWSPWQWPFRYRDAPILVSNTGKSHFRRLESDLKGGRSRTLEGQFGSNFRSLSKPIDAPLARELISVYTRMRNDASKSAIATCYADALPWLPPKVDRDRKKTYSEKVKEAGGTTPQSRCGSRKGPLSGGARG